MGMAELTERILALDGMVWQWKAMPAVLLIVGGLLTLATGFVQIRRFPAAVRMVFKGAFVKDTDHAGGTITPFQALSTALAATVGNGNIGGVATAILIGGPGGQEDPMSEQGYTKLGLPLDMSPLNSQINAFDRTMNLVFHQTSVHRRVLPQRHSHNLYQDIVVRRHRVVSSFKRRLE